MLELTRLDGVKMLVAPQHIVAIHPMEKPRGAYIETVNDSHDVDGGIKVMESIERIVEMMDDTERF